MAATDVKFEADEDAGPRRILEVTDFDVPLFVDFFLYVRDADTGSFLYKVDL